jgi:hypothetical protein
VAATHLALLGDYFGKLLLGLLLDLVGEEVGELLEEIGVVGEEVGDLVEDLLDAALLLLVCV